MGSNSAASSLVNVGCAEYQAGNAEALPVDVLSAPVGSPLICKEDYSQL